MPTFRSFLVRMPSDLRYWTVLDPAHRVVVEADDFLLHHRLGRDGAESTSQAYAASLALFFDWAASVRTPWRESAPYLGRFVYWLQHYRPDQTTTMGYYRVTEKRVRQAVDQVAQHQFDSQGHRVFADIAGLVAEEHARLRVGQNRRAVRRVHRAIKRQSWWPCLPL